jgi:hypothetical protein
MHTQIKALGNESAWSPWISLQACWKHLPACPGLYRIRMRIGDASWMVYLGQTGHGTAHLKSRLYGLRHVYEAEMPYKDPHVAGPPLWALRQRSPDAVFEVSVVPLPDVPETFRKGLEALAIALCRQRDGCSPLGLFGHMPAGYAPSTANTARLALAGKRTRGGPTTEDLACHQPGISPQGSLEGDPHARDWCGHHWTPWIPLQGLRPQGETGLYRLRVPGLDPLVFLGQGKLAERLKVIQPLARMECSWVANRDWQAHMRLELVTDAIAAHLWSTSTLPLWQFEPEHAEPDEDRTRKAS